jgi:hypothetical protein
VVYILLRVAHWKEATRGWHIFGALIVWILQYIAYQGILASSEMVSNSTTDLTGGIYLDLLGLTVLVQFGTALWSVRVYWLLAIVPPVGIWKLYTTLKSSMPGVAGMQQPDTSPPDETSDEKADKRRKRAERRRQKWS